MKLCEIVRHVVLGRANKSLINVSKTFTSWVLLLVFKRVLSSFLATCVKSLESTILFVFYKQRIFNLMNYTSNIFLIILYNNILTMPYSYEHHLPSSITGVCSTNIKNLIRLTLRTLFKTYHSEYFLADRSITKIKYSSIIRNKENL